MENISRGSTFGDFVSILANGIDTDQHGCKTTEYKSTDYPLPPLVNVLRESLSEDSQNIPCATLKRRGSWVISVYLWFFRFFIINDISVLAAWTGGQKYKCRKAGHICKDDFACGYNHLLHIDQSQITFFIFYSSYVAYIRAWMQSTVNTQVVNLNYACVR